MTRARPFDNLTIRRSDDSTKNSFFANLLDFATIEKQSAFSFQLLASSPAANLGTLNQELRNFSAFRGAFRVAV